MSSRLASLAALILIAATALAFSLPQDGEEALSDPRPSGEYVIDGLHSTVIFRIKHMGVANFYGRFNAVSGSYVLDFDDLSKCSISLAVEAASADTNSKDRDAHIRSADFLDAEEHPQITFQSTSVKDLGDDRLELEGELTLRGVTKTVSARAQVIGTGPTFFGDTRSGLEARLTIDRNDFGVSGVPGGLGPEIGFTISVEGILQE